MTPFGARIRALRRERGVSQKEMAAAIGVSAAYLSALVHGHRGRPPWPLLQKIIGYFNVIWDEAEELERLAGFSDPRIRIDTAGLTPQATELANMLAASMSRLDEEGVAKLKGMLEELLAARR